MFRGSRAGAISKNQPNSAVGTSHPEFLQSLQPKSDQAEVARTTSGKAKRTLSLSREDFSKLASAQSNRCAIAFGEIVRLLSQDPRYKNLRLEELQWLLMPAIASRQYLIGERKSDNGARGGVSAALLWARVSDEIDAMLSQNGKPVRLAPTQWKSGANVWLMAAIGSSGAIDALAMEFKRRIIPGGIAKSFLVDSGGIMRITTIRGSEAN